MKRLFSWLFQTATTQGPNSPAINVQGGGNAVINYAGMTSAEQEAFARQVAEKVLEATRGKGAPEAGFAAEQRVDQAVTAIAKGASEGDEQLQKALSLLAAGNVAQAVPLLEAVALEKTARIKQDSKDAALAYRNLGAIAGLGDPKQALDAYMKAIEFDADDVESLLWAGWLELDRGHLDEAEGRLRRVLLLAGNDQDARNSYWARLGLGDIRVQRGELSVARADYREAMAIAERLAQADPGNAGWQRDLSVSHNKIGDVQVAQGTLPAALTSYRASLEIRERLAQADPGNAGWQRDLALSYGRLAMVEAQQGARNDALSAFQQGREIVARLSQQSPDNATLHNDLAWFDEKITAQD